MRFKYLHLKKSRNASTQNIFESVPYPGRRRFVKTMGLGALIWSPMVDTIKSLKPNDLIFKRKNNNLKIYSQNRLVWEISDRYFESGYSLSFNRKGNYYLIEAMQLRFKQTDFVFSFNALIKNQNGSWNCQFKIPEFKMHWSGNFIHWLNGTQCLNTQVWIQENIVSLSSSDKLLTNGRFKFSMSPNWEFRFFSQNNIVFQFNNHEFRTGNLKIQPLKTNSNTFLKTNRISSTQIQLNQFNNWPGFIQNIELSNGKFKRDEGELPNLCFELLYNNSNEKVFWIESKDTKLFYQPEEISESSIEFNRFFYFAEYLNNKKTNSYISASLPENGFWISNKLGAFKIEKDNKLPDFEAFGNVAHFDEVVLEPRLRAFKPTVTNAITLSTEFQDPVKVRIAQPQKQKTVVSKKRQKAVLKAAIEQEEQKISTNRPAKNTTVTSTENSRDPQRPSRNITIDGNPPQEQKRPIQKKTPKISVEFDKVKFKPKRALSIKVLRPEDMVLLEFTFHNFNFTNKGQSPYLELDNEKNEGIVVINFQSQHTLEEAFYETTNIQDTDEDKPGSTNVTLPARHMRAKKSRLVYELPAGHEGFPLIMSELLDWSKYKLRVHPRAWIKLPTIKRIRKPSRIVNDKKAVVQPNKNLKYLDTSSTEYGIKLAQNTRTKASNLEVYNENQVSKVLSFQASSSVKSVFKRESLKKVNWKMGSIPALSTSIEAPTLMYISPNQTNDFYHKTQITFRDVEELTIKTTQQLNTNLRVLDPLSTKKGEITELWHTRLGVKLKNGKTSGNALQHLKTIRALWADDASTNYKALVDRNKPFMASLDANNRHKLVHTTSNYGIGFEPFPVPVNDLMLTTLGAYLDWHAFFDVPTPQDNDLNIIEWEHIATLGRDHFVKIVEEGYLFPFGHRAAVVKITERKFHQQTKSAVNRQRMFVVILEKEVLYSRNDPKGNFIEFPFQSILIKTNATPNIDDPAQNTLKSFAGGGGGNALYNFYIDVGGKGFPFEIIATDKEGQAHALRIPLIFLENKVARTKSFVEDVIKEYQKKKSDAYNEIDFNGQEVAYAKFLVDGDTAFETEMIKFDAQVYPVKGEGEIKFHPKIKEAKVFVEQITELTGSRKAATIGMEDDNNDGGVFARVISDTVVDFSGGSDKSGGFMVPNMGVSGLSKLQGPISGKLDDMKALNFVPEDFFEAFDNLPVAKIFGVINIFDLLFGDSGSPLDLGGTLDGMKNAVSNIREEIENIKNDILYLENLAEEAQEAVEEQINDLKQMIKDKVNELLDALNDAVPKIPNLKAFLTEDAFHVEYKWQPELGGTEIDVIPSLLRVLVDNPSTALSITTKLEKPFDAAKPAALNGLARFEKFGIDIVPLLAVNFNYLEFKTGSSEKTDVKVDINADNPIEFKGVLNFVNNLQSIIPSNGFSDSGPYIDLKPTGVTAGFDIAIPNVEVGICMISNISLGAFVTLPFTGAPLTMGFNFCRRENPFLLTISCFGGGGYFMMVTTLKGIQSIEAAFEFGAAMSLNVGVASGGVSAMGGFYYKMEIIEGIEQTTLTGYLRLNGHLSILGLISVSLEFYLAFIAVIYQGKVQKLEGVATLKVKVEVLFFSKTVSVSVRRELKGADADPKFVEMIDQDDWQEYCLAFAN
uniref:hypothetical protein n=1 Tax=uncultured Draconibacterium sp. TaxID=1573823 RepID=UPI0032179362